MKPFL